MSLKSSWFSIPKGSHFSLANIPFGIISHASGTTPRPAVAIGDHALDLDIFTANSGFRDLSTIQPHSHVFSQSTLNAFAALGRPMHAIVRKYIQSVFAQDTPYPEVLKQNEALQKKCLIPRKDVKMHMPMQIGDYTDFYAGLNHAYNVGVLFRGPDNALQPNYKHLPVGYHGRASSVVVSGTPLHRPKGQILENPAAEVKTPIYSPCKRLDIELELASFVCKPSELGHPVDIANAEDHLFGLVLMNDWSARDIQAWEYVPLGPFNSKNFGTSISAWVVLMDALEPFRTKGLDSGGVELLPYLNPAREDKMYDINLEVDIATDKGTNSKLSQTNASNLLFSFPQMVAHHTVTGCPLAVGDLMGSGTISGLEPTSCGSMLEQSNAGKTPIKLEGGEERVFLLDGDEVTIRGCCGTDENNLVGFGECRGKILPAV